MPKILLLLFLISIKSTLIFSQDSCECSDQNSIKDLDLFNDFYSPDAIQKNGIGSAKFYYEKNLEFEYTFSSSGFIVKGTRFDSNGELFDETVFNRDNMNNIIQIKEFLHLNFNNEHKVISQGITDYSYDSLNRLIKVKDRDFFTGELKSDSLSDYIQNKYDSLNRISSELKHYYFENENEIHESIIKRKFRYKTKNAFEIYEYSDQGLEIIIDNELDENNRLLYEKTTRVSNNFLIQIKEFTYSDSNKITSYKKTYFGNKEIFECPEKGTFEEIYKYNEFGLLDEVTHSYEDRKCSIKIKYE